MLLASIRRSSTHIRHLSWSASRVRTQGWNYRSVNFVSTSVINISPCSRNTKWLCRKISCYEYSQLHRGRGGEESSEYKDEDESGGDDHCDDNENEEEKEMGDNIDKMKIKSQVENIFTNKKEMSSKEWEETVELMGLENSAVTSRSCDALTMKKCLRYGNYHLGTSYMHHLEQKGQEPNLSTLGSYLQLCGKHVDQCGEARVLEYYHRLMSQAKVSDTRG